MQLQLNCLQMGQLRWSQNRVLMLGSWRLTKNKKICPNSNFLFSILTEILPFQKSGFGLLGPWSLSHCFYQSVWSTFALIIQRETHMKARWKKPRVPLPWWMTSKIRLFKGIYLSSYWNQKVAVYADLLIFGWSTINKHRNTILGTFFSSSFFLCVSH